MVRPGLLVLRARISWTAATIATLAAIVVVTAVFAALVWHRRWLADDGLIVLRTVRQILDGNGPVFNAFERAEASTSALWTWLLALAALLSRADIGPVAVAVGWLCSVCGVALALDATRRWHRLRGATTALVPASALVLLAVRAFWDFSTSGLEASLCIAWIAAIWWLLVMLPADASRRRQIVTVMVVGLGPLVRPELGLVSGVWLVTVWVIARPSLRRTMLLGAAAIALPLAYELFRAGFYGTLVPLPALAKSATHADWTRGYHYLLDFVWAYRLFWPALVLVVMLGGALRERAFAGRDRIVLAAPLVGGALVALYITRVGGDFMHGRLLLPATFLLLLPALLVPLRRATLIACVLLVAWASWTNIRIADRGRLNRAKGVVDERHGYVRFTKHDNPTTLDVFIRATPSAQLVEAALRDGRRVFITEGGDEMPMNPALDVSLAFAAGRLGTAGAVAPLDALVIDTLGLSNPLGARITITLPDEKPGHQKRLPWEWVVADAAHPSIDATSERVRAARRAMQCGELAELLASVREPLSPARFWANVVGAFRRTRLVIPADPIEAERRFCGTHRRDGED